MRSVTHATFSEGLVLSNLTQKSNAKRQKGTGVIVIDTVGPRK